MKGILLSLTIVLCLSETLARNSFKESWVTFTREDGSRSRDKLIVSEADQYITTKGDADTVIDFKRSLLILHTKDNGQDRCLVSTFKQTLFPTATDMLSLMETDEVHIGKSLEDEG